MLQNIHLKGVGPARELSLDFAPRLNLLTGDNGLGKSFVLDIAWWALTGSWVDSKAQPQEDSVTSTIEYLLDFPGASKRRATFNFETEDWDGTAEREPLTSLVLYARVDGFSVWDPLRNPRRWGEFTWGENGSSTRAYNFSPDELWNGLTEENRVLCEGLIRDWVSWQRQGTESFGQLREILRVLSPDHEELRPGEPVRVSLADVRDHPTLALPYGRVPLVFASAGMKRIIGLAYILVWAWQEHLQAAKLRRQPQAKQIVFLVDEIESHLHPKWQRLILPALLKVAESLSVNVEVQALITTHAPLVLASAEPLFDEEIDALFTFDLKGREVEVTKAIWRSRGDACSWLTSDVFDLGEARSVEAEQAIQHAKTAMLQPDLSIEERRLIHHELNAVLKDTDPFWGRWLMQAKAAGVEP